MRGWLKRLASTRLTLVGMGLLGMGAALSYDNPVETPMWVLVCPLALLALNLLAAILTNARIQSSGGLLVFHLGLLGIVVLAAIGRLSFFEAHVEMLSGNRFDTADLIDRRQGPWHRGALERVAFVQRGYTVDYRPGMVRGRTHSEVLIPDGQGGWDRQVVGDDTPLVLEGYRFYTTFNKGFSALVTWSPADGPPVTGAVNMPSYPLFDFRQANQWTTPAGETLDLRLQLETGLDAERDWRLDPARTAGRLVVHREGQRLELGVGEQVVLTGGRLRFEGLASWMGYKVFYDPTLKWLFLTAMIAVIGLATHFWRCFGPLRAQVTRPATTGEAMLGGLS